MRQQQVSRKKDGRDAVLAFSRDQSGDTCPLTAFMIFTGLRWGLHRHVPREQESPRSGQALRKPVCTGNPLYVDKKSLTPLSSAMHSNTALSSSGILTGRPLVRSM